MLTLGTPLFYSDLLAAYKNYKEKTNSEFQETQFINSLKELETTFLKYNSKLYDKNLTVEYSNPSVQDYLVNYFQNNITKIIPIVDNSSFYDQFITIFNFNNSSNKHKIALNDSSSKILKYKIINSIETMPSKKVKYSISYGNFLSRAYQLIRDNSILSDKIFFAEIRHKTVIHFLKKDLIGTDIQQIKDIIDFFNISKEIEESILFENMIILITTSEDFEDFLTMADYCEDFENWNALIEESTELKKTVISILKDIVTSEDEDDINDLLNDIDDLQDSFYLDDNEVKSIVLDAEALEFTKSEPEDNHEEYLIDKYANEKKENDISDLFDTLTK